MFLRKRIAAAAVATAMALTAFSSAVPVDAKNAQITYDPLDEVNHGVTIDTRAVPAPSNGDIKMNNGVIQTKRNVKFRLYSSVDSDWKVVAEDEANNSVGEGYVTIDASGMVRVSKEAANGLYKVTATAKNVEVVKTADIEIQVDGNSDAAKIQNITYDKSAVTNSQMVVSDDEMTLTVDGHIENEEIPIKYSPEYILDDKVVFADAKSQAYSLTDGMYKNSLITTENATSDSTIECAVGLDTTKKTQDSLKLIVTKQEFDYQIACSEKEAENNQYTLSKNQYVDFELVGNDDTSLPRKGISKAEWTFTQSDVELEKVDEVTMDGQTYTTYEVYDESKEGKLFATLYVAPDGRHFFVKTEVNGDYAEVKSIKAQVKVMGTSDNAGNDSTKTCTINFNKEVTAAFTEANLDFARAGLKENVDYVVKEETLGGKKVNVYYFEANGRNLNFADATFANIPGVRSFEESKDANFTNSKYTVLYQFSDLSAETFGSKEAAAKYNNDKLVKAELKEDGTLVMNNVLTKAGIGYKKVTVKCNEGTDEVSKKEYIIRFVSPSDEMSTRQYRVSLDEDNWYNIAEGEVVHVRKGESVAPGFYVTEDGEHWVATDDISITNPYIEYTISDETVANTIIDPRYKKYRINGLEYGVVTVTATGTVNKTNVKTFELYVNQDVMTSDFDLTFDDAIANGKVTSDNVILGRQESIPVNALPTSESAGIPVLTWEISDKTGEFATIDSKTGVITTKKTCNEYITVTAKDATGREKQIKFTIGKVDAKTIVALGEKEASGVLTNVTDTSATCKVGNTFTLAPVKYDPVNATDVSGALKWESTNTDVVTVDADGKVVAVGEGEAKIKASYTVNGKTTETEFTLTVSGQAQTVTAIVANNITIPFVGSSLDINATVLPESAPDKTLKYVSTDEKIAKVTASGSVTAIAPGTCQIIITSLADEKVTKTITVTVEGNKEITPNATLPPTAAPSVAPALVPTAAPTVAPETTVAPSKAVAKPGKVKSVKAKNNKKKAAKVTWKKINGVAGYQVQYALKKTFKPAKSVTAKKATVTVKGLKKKKTYFVRVRAFKKNGSKKVYGAWSAVAKVKIKK